MADRFKKCLGSNKIVMICLGLIALFVSMPLIAASPGKRELVSGMLNIMAAVIAYVCFWGCFESKEIGLLGSMLYTWCPYRISTLYLAGDFRESAAWCFLPMILLGLKSLYQETHRKSLWVLFTTAFSLLLLSSVTVFLIAVGTAFLWVLFQGKHTLKKERLHTLLKTVLATGLLNIWVLGPLLYDAYQNTDSIGSAIPADIRAAGLYPVSFLLPFCWGGESAEFWGNGMNGTLAAGAGFAVTVGVLFYLWNSFTGRYAKETGNISGKKLILLAGILIWFASSSFPWEVFQNKNLIFSIFLAWMKTPAKWGIGACAVLIFAICHAMLQTGQGKASVSKIIFGVTVGIAFLTTSFYLGNIWYTKSFSAVGEAGTSEEILWKMAQQSQPVWNIPREAVFTALFMLLAGAGVWIWHRNRKHPFSLRQQLSLFGVSAAVLLACLPLCVDYIVAGDHFSGGGSLLSVIALFHRMGFDLTTSWQMATAAVHAAGAWIAYGIFRKCFGSVETGVFGSVLFTLSPFRLYHIYNQAEVGGYAVILTILLVIPACILAKKLLNGWISLKAARGLLAGICLFAAVLAMYQLNDILNTSAPIRPEQIETALFQQ